MKVTFEQFAKLDGAENISQDEFILNGIFPNLRIYTDEYGVVMVDTDPPKVTVH